MNMFAKAAAAAPVKAPVAKKKATDEAVFMPGLEDYASICSVLTALEAIKSTVEKTLKNQGHDLLVTEGMRLKARPANFKGEEGDAQASVQLKAKASNIAIPTEDQALLTDAGVPLRTVDNVTKTFIINPNYRNDEALLAKVAKALDKKVPDDFILMQQDEKVVCDGDNTLNAIFGLGNREKIEALLPLVTSLAIRPTFTGDLETAMENVAKMLGGELVAKPTPPAKAKKAAKKADCAIVA